MNLFYPTFLPIARNILKNILKNFPPLPFPVPMCHFHFSPPPLRGEDQGGGDTFSLIAFEESAAIHPSSLLPLEGGGSRWG